MKRSLMLALAGLLVIAAACSSSVTGPKGCGDIVTNSGETC